MSGGAALSSGDVVSGLEPGELVEISRVGPFGKKTLVEGVTLETGRVVKRPLDDEQLAALTRVRGKDHTFQGNATAFLLGAEAERIRIAYQFDPLFAVNSSIATRCHTRSRPSTGTSFRFHGFASSLPTTPAPERPS